MNKLTSLFLTFIGLIFSIPLSPIFQVPGYDREVYRYVGMMITHGGVPYRDIFEHRPPGFYFLAAIFDFMGPWGIWFGTTLLAVVASLYLYHVLKNEGVVWPWFGPLVYLFLIRSNLIIEGGGLSREMSSALLLICFVRVFQVKKLDFFQGILIGLIFMTQPNDILGFFPVFLYLLFVSRDKLREFFYFLLGSSFIPILTLIYLGLSGALGDFVYQSFVFNMKHYKVDRSFGSLSENFYGITTQNGLFQLGLFLIICFAIIIFFNRKKITKKFVTVFAVLFICFLMQCWSAVASGRFYSYYFLNVLPFFALAFAFLIQEIHQVLSKYQKYTLFIPIFVFIAFFYVSKNDIVTKLSESYKAYPTYKYGFYDRWLPMLEEVRGQKGQLYVMRYAQALCLNTDLNIIAPSRWAYTHFWNILPGSWDPEGKTIDEIARDLDKFSTKYVLDFSIERPMPEAIQKKWQDYLTNHYELVGEVSGLGRMMKRLNELQVIEKHN